MGAARLIGKERAPQPGACGQPHLHDGHSQQLLVHPAVQVQDLVHLCGTWAVRWCGGSLKATPRWAADIQEGEGRTGRAQHVPSLQPACAASAALRCHELSFTPHPCATRFRSSLPPSHPPVSASSLVAKQVWPSCHRNSRDLRGTGGRQAGRQASRHTVGAEAGTRQAGRCTHTPRCAERPLPRPASTCCAPCAACQLLTG